MSASCTSALVAADLNLATAAWAVRVDGTARIDAEFTHQGDAAGLRTRGASHGHFVQADCLGHVQRDSGFVVRRMVHGADGPQCARRDCLEPVKRNSVGGTAVAAARTRVYRAPEIVLWRCRTGWKRCGSGDGAVVGGLDVAHGRCVQFTPTNFMVEVGDRLGLPVSVVVALGARVPDGRPRWTHCRSVVSTAHGSSNE